MVPRTRIGVIDVGSNSIRLVVYDHLSRAPFPIFNEKVLCALGRGLGTGGTLNPEGKDRAVANLTRFRLVAEGMGVARLDVLATAAVRDAADGPAFVARIQAEAGLSLTILDGIDEARLAGYGVLSGIPDADGLVGDLGGGSLELVTIDQGTVTPRTTLPLGYLRLMEGSGNGRPAAEHIAGHLGGLEWLPACRGRPLYLVGGSWRAIARQHLEHTGYPLHVIHRYTVAPDDARTFAAGLVRADRSGGDKAAPGGRRADTLPMAAAVMGALIEAAAPSSVVFSAYGLREGHLYGLLSPEQQALDPLIEGCRDLVRLVGRFGPPELLFPWTDGIFPGEDHGKRRLRQAACLLGDLGWMEHPDYRATHAFLRVLRLPIPGLDHVERTFLALAVYIRYGGGARDALVQGAAGLLTEGQVIRATVLGLAMRLGHSLVGGAAHCLADTALRLADGKVVLSLPPERARQAAEVPRRRLAGLAEAMGRPFEIRVRVPAPERWPHVVMD